MIRFVKKYHLQYGFLLSIILPALFIFQETVAERMLVRFVSVLCYIFSLWIANFILVDFSKNRSKNTFIWFFRIVVAFLLTTSVYIFIGFYIDSTETMLSQVRGEKIYSLKSWLYLCLRLFLLNILVLIIKYLFDTYEEKSQIELENEALKNANLNALHETLKQQLKPHFLFNSLNTLKSLIKRDPELAEQFVNELSQVYRYMLTHQIKKVVSVKEEMDFLNSYLYLLRIRFGESISTSINIPVHVQSAEIPPNTLQILIENSVKHNAFSLKKPLVIKVYYIDEFLVVENNLQYKEENSESSNLGLYNINSRYKLLFNKEIVISKTQDCFKVLLPLFN